jgi:hypothetical protein
VVVLIPMTWNAIRFWFRVYIYILRGKREGVVIAGCDDRAGGRGLYIRYTEPLTHNSYLC